MQGADMPGGTHGDGMPGMPPAERGRDSAPPCPPSASGRIVQHRPAGGSWEQLGRAEPARSVVQEWELRQSNAARPRPGLGPGQGGRGAPVVHQEFDDYQHPARHPEPKRARPRQHASPPGGDGDWRERERERQATRQKARPAAAASDPGRLPMDHPAAMRADMPLGGGVQKDIMPLGGGVQKDISELIFTAHHKTHIEEALVVIQVRLHRHRLGEAGGDEALAVARRPGSPRPWAPSCRCTTSRHEAVAARRSPRRRRR
jgi:hypothetical protein